MDFQHKAKVKYMYYHNNIIIFNHFLWYININLSQIVSRVIFFSSQ